ncbi:tetratricopeptide repeat protein [Nocardia sp. NPDC050710]|uniref:tetratricopeptide repeat protein n=1 Tax=Nocardia sp. NPDC050710 TaxID=3157220 RepID=UPI0033C55432
MRQVGSVVARARAATNLGRVEEARQIVGAALLGAPDDPVLLELMADLAYRLDRNEEALRYALAAIAADPNRFDAYLTAALAFDVDRRHDEAIRYARMGVRLAPDSDSALLTLARGTHRRIEDGSGRGGGQGRVAAGGRARAA